jgi:hypothetical protein
MLAVPRVELQKPAKLPTRKAIHQKRAPGEESATFQTQIAQIRPLTFGPKQASFSKRCSGQFSALFKEAFS